MISAGAKNMASSSGWPMRRMMRLLRSSKGGGNREVNIVLDMNQKTMKTRSIVAMA